jgi:acyl dehydratase
MPGLDDLIGTTFGPYPVDATPQRAASFLEAIGGDRAHDPQFVHPMFANAALFAAAPAFLDDDRVRPFTTSLIHSEQRYEWHRPVEVGADLEVQGTVDSVRGRGAINLVTFGLTATVGDDTWLTGSSVFLMSEAAAAVAADAPEPDSDARPPVDVPPPADLPEEGHDIPVLRCGASRADLVRYAEASGDRNPIHLDHEAARRAGLEGVIVHGLLMAAWVGRAAGRYGPLAAMRIRFRNPLRPALQAFITGSVRSIEPATADLDLSLTAGDIGVVTARIAVTR